MQESLIGTHLQVQVLLNIFTTSYTFYTKFEDAGKEGREGGREGGREERGWDTGRGERGRWVRYMYNHNLVTV